MLRICVIEFYMYTKQWRKWRECEIQAATRYTYLRVRVRSAMRMHGVLTFAVE